MCVSVTIYQFVEHVIVPSHIIVAGADTQQASGMKWPAQNARTHIHRWWSRYLSSVSGLAGCWTHSRHTWCKGTISTTSLLHANIVLKYDVHVGRMLRTELAYNEMLCKLQHKLKTTCTVHTYYLRPPLHLALLRCAECIWLLHLWWYIHSMMMHTSKLQHSYACRWKCLYRYVMWVIAYCVCVCVSVSMSVAGMWPNRRTVALNVCHGSCRLCMCVRM